MVITESKTMTCTPSELTVGVLQDFMQDFDPSARVTVRHSRADRPGVDADALTIEVRQQTRVSQ